MKSPCCHLEHRGSAFLLSSKHAGTDNKYLPEQELDELMEYSAKFDIRPRTRFIVTSLFLGLFSFILSCIAEEEKYSKSEVLELESFLFVTEVVFC